MRVLILSIVVLTVINLVSAEINRLSADLLQNGRAHHTDKYQLSLRTLIVRRGGDIALTISGRGEQATIKVQVKLGDEVLDHFDVGANRPDVDKKSSWSSTIDEVDRDLETNNTLVNTTTYEVSFRLHVPVRSPIGQFDILVSEEGAEGRNLVQQAYILFNPWNSGKCDNLFVPVCR